MARKKAEAHHGGAWKVAYADFVTAMMALFMVLWISAQDKKILIATSQYFQNPFHSPVNATSGVMPSDNQASSSRGGDGEGSADKASRDKQIEMTFLNSVASELSRMLNMEQDVAEKPIDIQVTSDGLRIIVYDRAKKPLFVGNTAEFTEWGNFTMQNLSWTIDRHHFRVMIDGHTKAKLDLNKDDYGAWELSADRANAARRLLVHYAVEAKMIDRVAGYADTRPMPDTKPEDESNQRVTISLTLSSKSRAKETISVEQAARDAQPKLPPAS